MAKRTVVLYLLCLGVILGGVPYFTGMLVETKFQDIISTVSDADGAAYNLEVLDYQRGWRKSIAKTKLTLMLPRSKKNPQSYSIVLIHELRHGPFVQLKDGNYQDWHFARALISSKLLLSDKAKKVLAQEVGETELFNINSEITIGGAVSIRIDGKSLKLKEHDDSGRIAWKGITGQWDLSSDLKHLTGKIIIPGVDLDYRDTQVYLEGLSYQTDITKAVDGLWPGKFWASLHAFSINQNKPQNFDFQMKGFKSEGIVTLSGDVLGLLTSLHLEKISFTDRNKYQTREAGPFIYTNEIKNIDLGFVKTVLDMSKKLRSSQESAQQPQVLVQTMSQRLPDLLRRRPEFKIDPLRLHTDQGDIDATFSFAIGGSDASNINMMNEIVQSIVSKAKASVPKLLVQELLSAQNIKTLQATNQAAIKANASIENAQIPVLSEQELILKASQQANEMIADWIKNNFIIDKGDSYVAEFDFVQGQATLNGRPFSLKNHMRPKATGGYPVR